MKKEVGLAVFFGVGLGLLVAFIMVLQIRHIKPKDSAIAPTPIIKVKATADEADTSFSINKPSTDSIVASRSVNVEGKAEKGALVVIQSPLNESILKTTSDHYSVPFTLALGENIINVTMYPVSANTRIQQKTVKVYYLDEQ